MDPAVLQTVIGVLSFGSGVAYFEWRASTRTKAITTKIVAEAPAKVAEVLEATFFDAVDEIKEGVKVRKLGLNPRGQAFLGTVMAAALASFKARMPKVPPGMAAPGDIRGMLEYLPKEYRGIASFVWPFIQNFLGGGELKEGGAGAGVNAPNPFLAQVKR